MKAATSLLQALLLTATLSSLPGLQPARAESEQTLEIEPRRSLIVTELSILSRFPLKRTMDQLAGQTGVPGLTGERLFRQWFDIMNPKAEATTSGPHCDDVLDPVLGVGLLNTFPYTCRPGSKQSEGLEASLLTDPMDGYTPITLTNRFDQAPGNGKHCGEYRIVYARSSGLIDTRNRNLLIFEATLPNPHPDLGLKGCKDVVKFWAQLSKERSSAKRAVALERFYYSGYAGFMPVIHFQNFGENENDFGQIRTNQFMQPTANFASPTWSLREFKLKVVPGQYATIVPATVKVNPFGALFQSSGTHPLTTEFQNHFLTQVKSLATSDFSFTMDVPDKFNTGQSQANGTENNYVTQLGGDTSPFGQRIQQELTRIQSTLTPTEIVARAQSLSCAGCHRLNANPGFSDAQRSLGGGLIFPTSLDFTHSSERVKEVLNGEEAWVISPVLKDLLLPARKQIMIDYLTDKLKNPRRPQDPISGKPHHG